MLKKDLEIKEKITSEVNVKLLENQEWANPTNNTLRKVDDWKKVTF